MKGRHSVVKRMPAFQCGNVQTVLVTRLSNSLITSRALHEVARHRRRTWFCHHVPLCFDAVRRDAGGGGRHLERDFQPNDYRDDDTLLPSESLFAATRSSMAPTKQAPMRQAITLKGSTNLVTEFFKYAVNTSV